MNRANPRRDQVVLRERIRGLLHGWTTTDTTVTYNEPYRSALAYAFAVMLLLFSRLGVGTWLPGEVTTRRRHGVEPSRREQVVPRSLEGEFYIISTSRVGDNV